ncbi:octopamine receptor Oamb-like [Hydractinia symbiolongicarpus]|uniref:octopamine receptor Oamb-like n=1 Tax=Hydractinia symbiolongicarpus TaxID=13093 RepID=UPI00254D7C19|nr:octopamine receptor Oamb-like [Hydractinia symbiolongicarpus]XP_057307486.1 octopamine receptor Oamb-like [Hydractinia symbiolongicarpus]
MEKNSIEILELFYLTLVVILTLLGNCLVISAFVLGPRSIRTYTNYFVVNLAVTDLMVGCLSLPFWIVYRIDNNLVSDKVYSYFIKLDILCGTSSILSLVSISVERMFAVKFPTTHYNLDRLPVIIAMCVTWVLGIVFTAIKVALPLPIYTTCIFVMAFIVPLLIIIFSYCVIFYAAMNMIRASNQPGRIVRELHVAKTISFIIGLFIFCWMPFFIVNMVVVHCGSSCRDFPMWLIYLSKMMHYSNSMMNFFVYAVRSPDFRRSFKAILFKCDTSTLRERIRTFSESVVTRSRSASERYSFVHDNHENGQANGYSSGNGHVRSNGHLSTTEVRFSKLRTSSFKTSRLSNTSNCTDASVVESSSSNGSRTPYVDTISESSTLVEVVSAC